MENIEEFYNTIEIELEILGIWFDIKCLVTPSTFELTKKHQTFKEICMIPLIFLNNNYTW